METIVTAHGGDEPSMTVEMIEEERDFQATIDLLMSATEAGEEIGSEIAVGVTPGRRFWSIISFRADYKERSAPIPPDENRECGANAAPARPFIDNSQVLNVRVNGT